MIDKILRILDFRVDLKQLVEYYNTVVTEYQHLKWDYNTGGKYITQEWQDRMESEPATLLPYGWAIQSNIEENEPCPPYNITTHKRIPYHNTELVFGLVKELQEKMPYAYRWAISVQPPGGKVSLHCDQEDELTVWIPIYSNDDSSITYVIDEVTYLINLPATGNLYLLDTTFPHYTINNGNTDRVAIIFRLNMKYRSEIVSL